jgi:hypothetical protein
VGSRRPTPGTDEIIVSPPWGQRRCTRVEHNLAGVPAQVIVTFGPLGDAGRAVLFPYCSRRSFALCAECWQATRDLAGTVWAGLTLTGTG